MSIFASHFAFALLVTTVFCQQIGTNSPEIHPKLPWKKCTAGGCVVQSGEIVLDADFRWTHNKDGYNNCYDDKERKFNATLCPDAATCAKNCAVEGVTYADYGVTTEADALTMKLVPKNGIGSRLYFLDEQKNYKMFKLLDQELTFDVDMAKLPCGTNGALYFAEMEKDGGASLYEHNKAGAQYGTGYCDAQCAHGLKFIHGEVSLQSHHDGVKTC
jgi:cellulose 1,4-beta-cellobiosidase